MGQRQSKGELLYQQVSYGNTEGIKALHREGADLEWIDREGKTPLIVACMNPELSNVVKTLIELGSNVNAYRPGRNAGTPLHHAAKRGLESTVKLLLSHGANALVMNDDCQTPLDVARAKGHTNVVRAIESHICLFSGWLREFYGPGFLEVLAPQLLSRKVWVVILPGGSRNFSKPLKLELAIYYKLQDAQPRIVIALWKANLEEPKFHHSDPSVIIVDNSTITRGRRRRQKCRPRTYRQTRIKLAPANENDNQQLKWFCDACKGIPQARPAFLHNSQTPVPPTAPAPDAEDLEMAMAINASIQSAMQDGPTLVDAHPSSGASSSNSVLNTTRHGKLGVPIAHACPNTESMHEAGPGVDSTHHMQIESNIAVTCSGSDSIPSAPPVADEIIEDGPINYLSIDSSLVDMSASLIKRLPNAEESKAVESGAICVICLDAPAEGACIPCGHVAGCMSCLNEIKTKKWGCPVCRTKIDQVIKLYHV